MGIFNDNDFVYRHRELIHVNNDGHLDTENRNIVVKDAVNSDHAVSKLQLENISEHK